MSEGKKTTKEILSSISRGNTKMPLFDSQSLKSIKKDFTDWKNTKVTDTDRANYSIIPETILGSQIPRNLIYPA
ncbi:MAG: hypothetical protein M1409_09555 [Actinobacteria bacterium]|nr:hypothetical protein [Actinomycetota bacterium]